MTEGMEIEDSIRSAVRDVLSKRRIPSSTYRLQLNSSFKFSDVTKLIPYLYELGVSDIYLSPFMKARSGSSHGYDICAHNKLNPELGGKKNLEKLKEELSHRGMGLIMDLVPNHMCIFDAANTWWFDVLENGPSSRYAEYFDIDWNPVKQELKDKVLLPILEDQYGKVLESGKFKLAIEKGAFVIYCGGIKLPVAPRTYSCILTYRIEKLVEELGHDNAALQELQSIVTALNYLPPREEENADKIEERTREKEIIKRRIDDLYKSDGVIHRTIDATISKYNGIVGEPDSFDFLDALIGEQAYRPAFWRVAAEEINYRRFFDINGLAAIRMEVPEVFRNAHRMVFDMLSSGTVTGLRIDHADGLWNPADYLRRLQYRYLFNMSASRLPAASNPPKYENVFSRLFNEQYPKHPAKAPAWPLFVVVEKILSEEEPLPQGWGIYGTTGYDFLNVVNGLFVDSDQEEAYTGVYADFIAERLDYSSLARSAKKLIMLVSLASEIYALSHQISGIIERNRRYRDFTLNALAFAIREIIASLGIYRSYITGPGSVSKRDLEYLSAAVRNAKKLNPRTSATLFDFLLDTLLLRNLEDFPEKEREQLIRWVMKFQQITGSVMAKGLEDTAFYIYNRLVSLNEVGGDPKRFGISTRYFHRHNIERMHTWPHSMLASTTHDTKRSEDFRARINVLSEISGEWAVRLKRWRDLNASFKTRVDGEMAPDTNDEYLFYQTLLGAWPAPAGHRGPDARPDAMPEFSERMVRYMQKAIKEAKVHTSWVNPNEAYDDAVVHFISSVLNPKREDGFWEDFSPFLKRLDFFGFLNAVSQLLLKLTCPGIPDIYQGAELWDLRLVDPDNRGPVDFPARIACLEKLKEECGASTAKGTAPEQHGNFIESLVRTRHDGGIKLYVLYRALRYRRDHFGLFTYGDYIPIQTGDGPKSRHICSFMRRYKRESVIVAVPRLFVGLTDGHECMPTGEDAWQDTLLLLPELKAGVRCRNVFTDEHWSVEAFGKNRGLPAAAVFKSFPVALLEIATKE